VTEKYNITDVALSKGSDPDHHNAFWKSIFPNTMVHPDGEVAGEISHQLEDRRR
jgi:hypothetical protein